MLKPGGELYFCDVYSSRRPSPEIMKDPVLHGECLSGAMYWNDFIRLSQKCGFIDPRCVPLWVATPGCSMVPVGRWFLLRATPRMADHTGGRVLNRKGSRSMQAFGENDPFVRM